MHFALRALEFDRIVAALAELARTPFGRARLEALTPLADAAEVRAAQAATTEGVRFHAEHGFDLSAPDDLEAIVDGLGILGRPLEPAGLLGLAAHLDSAAKTRETILQAAAAFPALAALAADVSPFGDEVARVRRAIEPGGDVTDQASPELGRLRSQLRTLRQRLRSSLDAFVRGRDTSRYLQDRVITERGGRAVLVVRAEHRGDVPGIVHGTSASGASLFLEPIATVEINNDIVAAQEREAEEIHRVLLALTDAFRARQAEMTRTLDRAAELDVIQARARFSGLTGGVEPAISNDGAIDLRAARHPLLVLKAAAARIGARMTVVPVDVVLLPPARVLVITGPNTGGKTVALKTAGLLALMAQSGLHIPAAAGSRLPVFRSLFADIGDEQSIAASLSTFSGHIANVVAMDRELALPALVLLDELGAGTDPVEGGALGMAILDHFRARGAHLVATTHDDALKSYASTTPEVVCAAFGFDPSTFAPTYGLRYGTAGRSLAIEIAARLGMPAQVIASARERISGRERQLSEHLAKIEEDMRAIARDRQVLERSKAALASAEARLKAREDAHQERETTLRQRMRGRLDDHLRGARREIDAVVAEMKAISARLVAGAGRAHGAPLAPSIPGQLRSDARAALDQAAAAALASLGGSSARQAEPAAGPLEPGARVTMTGLGLEGTVVQVLDDRVDIDVRGKRLRAPAAEVRVVASAPQWNARRETPAAVKLHVDLQPRDAAVAELNVVGCTVDEALDRVERFLDSALVTDQRTVRIVHGHGTGQLRRAITAHLREHPLVARAGLAQQEHGGAGVTVVEIRE
ncbi:MAG: hypothetical protein FJW23_02705 [Acidimicrobiia bacterium]|nr:hypothetical protein [Acidimicrobiia bacterium]